ncbi:LacI family DNA-binding transcriptional regulator [Marinomonas sp. IMCC 4694]|uniref:LacI family DNA-binding transcriptional regulator n=1 Tax=Marinomonas sp. IMCC 4694 TaxID=2605432 RepID=UPI0011E775E2|nr:LacI family DNA-binding transcriptional regulator [Marinomonas sp. IMCC 4694]
MGLSRLQGEFAIFLSICLKSFRSDPIRMSNKSVTIHELASLAGVSIASVSRALNGKPGISEALRARIISLSEEINYKPNVMARQLISGKTPVVALCMPPSPYEFSDRPYFVHLYQALTLYLHRKGLVPVLFAYENIEDVFSQACSAILLGAAEDDRPEIFDRQKFPCVTLETGVGASVVTDEANGMYKLTHYLFKKGRKNLLFLGENIDISTSQGRLRGYRKAVAELGLQENFDNVPSQISSSLSAYRQMMGHFQSSEPFPYDAVVCANDELAVGVIQAAEDAGYKVPEDISVTGFDDLPRFSNKITTIHQDIPKIAEAAVSLLSEQLDGLPPRVVEVMTRLVSRESA